MAPRRAMILALCLPVLLLPARASRAARGQSLEITAGLSANYDDNILQYSREQLQLFESGTRPERFSLETRDDAVFGPSLALAWEADRGRNRWRGLAVKGSGSFHGKNGTADFRALAVSYREQLGRDQRLLLRYYWLPRFYLRQLFDEDARVVYSGLSRYRRAQFALQIGSASWMQPVSRSLRLQLDYKYENRRYNSTFRERDSGTHDARLGAGLRRLPRAARFDAWGGYRVSHARADDGDGEPAVQDDVDLGYHGVVAGVQGRVELTRSGRWRLAADAEYELETRVFDSDRPADRYHFGRKDLSNAGELGLNLTHRPHWSLRAFYRIEDNRADLGAAAPASTDAGTYRENLVGGSIEWSGALWRQSPPEGEKEEP